MTRRTLVAHLDPRVERPELRTFTFEPVAQAKAERVRYVTAALTILLAFKAAGSPRQSSPLGSFEEWSLLVRDALIWLGCADPVETMERARVSDPKLDELSAVLTQWQAVIGTDRITVRRVIEKASRQSGGAGYDYNPKEFDNPDFREALLAVAGQGGAINGKRLGKWLGAHAKRIAGGCWIEPAGGDGRLPDLAAHGESMSVGAVLQKRHGGFGGFRCLCQHHPARTVTLSRTEKFLTVLRVRPKQTHRNPPNPPLLICNSWLARGPCSLDAPRQASPVDRLLRACR